MLKEYEQKRDFSQTGEPPPVGDSEKAGPLTFVVQKHAARRLHYDLRLEFNGVLKSWALPRGPSMDPGIKRLAVMVEDHPLEYGSFEGSIPRGEYGAGEVIVWDSGDYSPDDGGRFSFGDRREANERMGQALKDGKISITLRGHKLKGSWTLVRMRGGKGEWLLIKHGDEMADSTVDILQEDRSVHSGLTVEQIRGGQLPDPHTLLTAGMGGLSEATEVPLPTKIAPMLAATGDAPFSHPQWIFEPKLDGYRTIAIANNGDVRLLSRNGIDVTAKYEIIGRGIGRQPVAQVILDGEIIALDKRGRPSFQRLQDYQASSALSDGRGGDGTVILYYVFDILYLDGYDLQSIPLIQRKRVLDRILCPTGVIRPVAYFEGDGGMVYRGSIDQGLEGIMAKKSDSRYEEGKRSSHWLKIKSTLTEEFIIGGYTEGSGSRAATFGALILGRYDDQNRLIHIGNVGTGFDERALTSVKKILNDITSDNSPFAEAPEVNAPPLWVRPILVAEVKFSEWTEEQKLRTPVFVRLRGDKPVDQVERMVVRCESPSPSSDRESDESVPPIKSDADETIANVLHQLDNRRDISPVEVDGFRLHLTNLNKILWPPFNDAPAITKRDFLIYMTRLSPYLLNHLRDRPLTLIRFPDGIGGEQFYQKHWHNPVPDFVRTVPLSEHRKKGEHYILANNLPTLLWLGQAAVLELHTWFSCVTQFGPGERVSDKDQDSTPDTISRYPDVLVFDLDPFIYAGTESPGGEPELNRSAFQATCEAALWVKETLDALSLHSFVKTSGRTGLHIYVPLKREIDFHAVHSTAKTICQFIQQRHPQQITVEWPVEKRTGKVFLDYNQNVRGKTLASTYSPRAVPEGSVSTPLGWDELGRVYPTDFTMRSLPDRLSKIGDLWADISRMGNDLKGALGGELSD